MKRDLRKAEEEEKWREKANNRDQWEKITKVAVQRRDNYTSLTPTINYQSTVEYANSCVCTTENLMWDCC